MLNEYILDDTFKFYQRSINNSGCKKHVLGVYLNEIRELIKQLGAEKVEELIKDPKRNRHEFFPVFFGRLAGRKIGNTQVGVNDNLPKSGIKKIKSVRE